MNSILKKLMQVTSCIALMVVTTNVNAACVWVLHQPELPKCAMKLKK